MKLSTDPQLERWLYLFGKDTGSYSVVLVKGNDIVDQVYTGGHVACLVRMRNLLNSAEGRKFDAYYHMDLLNNETGRLVSWSV